MDKKVIVISVLVILVIVLGIWSMTKTSQIVEDDEGVIVVNLYYHNSQMDPDFEGLVFPVQREIEREETVEGTINKVINMLISGDLTEEEIETGFSTEFPHPDFQLIELNLLNGRLALTFTEVPGFTTGGSLRTGILAKGIRQTALQFEEVTDVIIEPEGNIFQP